MSVFRRTPAPAINGNTSRSAHSTRLPARRRLLSAGASPNGSPNGNVSPGSLAAPPNTLPYSTPRPITASARQINLKRDTDVEQLQRRLNRANNWQQQAWDYYDAIGEIKYGFTIVSTLLSRLRLYAGFITQMGAAPQQANPSTTGGQAAIAALGKLDSIYGGQQTLIRTAGLNFLVTGECYLVQTPAVPGDPDRAVESWDIRSIDEVVVDSSHQVRLRSQRRQSVQEYTAPLPKQAYVGRLWRRHPRFCDDADSSMLPLLELCSELLLLNRTYRATARSRLNAGALYLPDGLSVAAQPDAYDEDDADHSVDPALFTAPEAPDDPEDDFEDALIEAMTTPITDESSASSIVPLIIRGPAELGDKIKQFKFERSFDAALTARADRVLDRIMQGIDVPKDVVTGLANVKYANAIVINQDLYKAHIEPLALLLCDCLTTAFLRPAMQSFGIDPLEAERYCIWYDPTMVTSQPDKAEDADSGADRHLLSGNSWRKAHGFSDDDAPSPEELSVQMLMEKGTFTPELTEALLTVVAPDVMANVRAASQASNPAPLPPEVANILSGESPSTPPPGSTSPQANKPTPSNPPPAPDEKPPGEVITPEQLV